MNPDPTSLDLLNDIVVPPPAPWWPPAPAWYWVLGFLVGILLVFLLRGFVRWQRNRYRREALVELSRLEPSLGQLTTRYVAVREMAEVLKRAALSTLPREQVAGLVGSAWFDLLDRMGRTTDFSRGSGTLLELAAYDMRSADALDESQTRELLSTVRRWIVDHRVENVSGGSR
jgi:hypothetical protein